MIPSSWNSAPIGLVKLIVVGAILLAGPRLEAQDVPKEQTAAPAGSAKVTKEDLLHKIPNFFCYDYPFGRIPGKHLWLRVDDRHFVERDPEGADKKFEILSRATVREQSGTILVKIAGGGGTDNAGGFQVFIPDKGTDMAILFRHLGNGNNQWLDMSWSQNRKTIIQQVE